MSNLQWIRKLMADAFSSDEINTLTFDYFSELYGDVSSISLKSAKIELLVSSCERNGWFPALGRAIAKLNPYQFARYAEAWSQLAQK